MAEGLLVLGDYDLTAYWHIESHDFGSENLSFQTMDTGLEVFDTDVSEGQVESTWILSPQKPTTWAAIQSNYRSLVAELRKQTNFLQLRGPNTDEIFTYDSFRSPVPSLFSTDGAAASVTHNVILELTIRRRPYARTDTLLASVNKLSNSWPLKEGSTADRPLNWAWLSATDISAESIDNDGYHFTIATGDVRSLQQTTAVGSFASGDVVTKSFYVQASAASIVQAQAAVQFKQSDGTTNVGSEHVGTLTAIPAGTDWTRVSVTTTAAGTLTSRALVSVRFDNSAATSVDVTVQRIQAEVGSTASEFRIGRETLSNDPSGFCVLPVWNPGDAGARADIYIGRTTAASSDSVSSGALVAQMDGPNLAQWANDSLMVETLTTANGTVATSPLSGASGDAGYTQDFATSGTSLVSRGSFDPATHPGLADRSWRVLARLKTSAISTDYSLHVGFPADVFPTVTEGTLWTPLTTGDWVLVDLGSLYVSENAGQLVVFSAARVSGTGSLLIDGLVFVPIDPAYSILVPQLTMSQAIRIETHGPTIWGISNMADQLRLRPTNVEGLTPMIPPGLSGLVVFKGQARSSPEVILHSISQTIGARVDITPQRHQ